MHERTLALRATGSGFTPAELVFQVVPIAPVQQGHAGSRAFPANLLSRPEHPINSQSTMKIRLVPIGIIVGAATLIVVSSFFLCFRKCKHKKHKSTINIIVDDFDAAPNSRRNTGARLSTLFGIGNKGIGAVSRMNHRQDFATSIHYTAGMAGIGAHRLGTGNIQYHCLAGHGNPDNGVKARAVSVSDSSKKLSMHLLFIVIELRQPIWHACFARSGYVSESRYATYARNATL